MRKFYLMIGLVSILLLAACNGNDEAPSEHGSVNDGEPANGAGSVDHGVDKTKPEESAEDNNVGFSLSGENVEEAAGVPTAEKKAVLKQFDTYIDAFNDKAIDKYMAVLSMHTDSFDIEEERTYMTDVFSQFELDRVASDVTIVKYSDTEVQVFANLQTSMKQISSGLETNQEGRQVTVFTKDDGEWKVASIHYIGNE